MILGLLVELEGDDGMCCVILGVVGGVGGCWWNVLGDIGGVGGVGGC